MGKVAGVSTEPLILCVTGIYLEMLEFGAAAFYVVWGIETYLLHFRIPCIALSFLWSGLKHYVLYRQKKQISMIKK